MKESKVILHPDPMPPTGTVAMAGLPLPADLLYGAAVQAMKEVLHESGWVDDLLQTTATIRDVKLLKEGLLTYPQAAKILQVSLRTFQDMMGRKKFPKHKIMGEREPRVLLSDLLTELLHHREDSAREEKLPGRHKLTALLHPRETRRKAA